MNTNNEYMSGRGILMLEHRMKRRVANAFIVAGLFIPLCIASGIIYVALHFIIKFW